MTGQENKALSRSNSNTSSGCWFLRKTPTGLLGVPDGEIREAISHSGDLVAWSSWKKKEYRKWEGETEPAEQEDMRIPTTGAEIWVGRGGLQKTPSGNFAMECTEHPPPGASGNLQWRPAL